MQASIPTPGLGGRHRAFSVGLVAKSSTQSGEPTATGTMMNHRAVLEQTPDDNPLGKMAGSAVRPLVGLPRQQRG